MTRMVFDSSALIASIYEEKGYEVVDKYLSKALISTVNITEVASFMIDNGTAAEDVRDLLKDLSIDIVPYNEDHTFIAAELRKKTKSKGLSLGDRACLALAISEELPVLTADKIWSSIDLGVKVNLIR